MEITLTKEEARSIISGDHKDFEIVQTSIDSVSRWSVHISIVVKRLSDGKFFESSYSEGATEAQDEKPYEWDEPKFTEVVPTQKLVTVYETV